jgi:enamine deaminase RidA (YjgF/YER057c/UK114 family)
VNADAEFTQHPVVINGVSDLLVGVFGEEIGRHARFAVGSSSLPFNAPVEVAIIAEVAL